MTPDGPGRCSKRRSELLLCRFFPFSIIIVVVLITLCPFGHLQCGYGCGYTDATGLVVHLRGHEAALSVAGGVMY